MQFSRRFVRPCLGFLCSVQAWAWKDFVQGDLQWIFSNVFLEGSKSGKSWFLPLENNLFLLKISKSRRGFGPSCPHFQRTCIQVDFYVSSDTLVQNFLLVF